MNGRREGDWLLSGPRRDADLTLYCFPHGGGGAVEYVRWGRELAGVHVKAVQLPGRGTRLGTPGITSMPALVAALVEAVPFETVGRYAFFGHSLGSLVAYEVAAALRAAGRPLPERLVVSGVRAPCLPRRPASRVHEIEDDAELVRTVAERHGGFPAEVLDDPRLLRLVVGAVRADYAVAETYRWGGHAPLPVPVTVLGGREDAVDEWELRDWGLHTTHPVTVSMFPGGHFYLRDQGDAVRAAVAGALLPSAAPSLTEAA